MQQINIVIKGYSINNSRRQPWYTAKYIERLLGEQFDVQISDTIVDNTLNIKFFGIKDLFRYRANDTLYVMSFPRLRFSTFFKNFFTFSLNMKNFYKIIIVNIILYPLLKAFLYRNAQKLIFISDSYDDIMPKDRVIQKLIPINDFPDRDRIKLKHKGDKTRIIYYGPALELRGMKKLVQFINNRAEKEKFPVSLILRNDRFEVYRKNVKLLSKLKRVGQFDEFEINFDTHQKLMEKVQSADVAFLPFVCVYSEFPVVIVECLLQGIPVITTRESGFSDERWSTIGLTYDLSDIDMHQSTPRNYTYILEMCKDAEKNFIKFISYHGHGVRNK